MGRSPPRSKCVRGMVRLGEVAPHQSSRNEGPLPGSSGISGRCHRSSRDSDVRKLNGRGVRQQTRGHGFPALCLLTSRLLRWTESFDVHLDARYLPGESNVLADLLSRRGQVVGTEWSLHPQVARSLLHVWGNPSIDLFRRASTRNCPCIARLSWNPRPSSRMRFAILGTTGSVRVPSLSSGRSGGRPRPRVVAGSDDSGRTSLAREGVVCRLTASSDPATPGSALLGQTTSATPLQSVPLRRPRAEPSRVATLNVTSEIRAFREGLLESCQESCGSPPLDYTSRDGRSSVEGALLQSTPLYQ